MCIRDSSKEAKYRIC